MGGFVLRPAFAPVPRGWPCADGHAAAAASAFLDVLPKSARPRGILHSRLVVGKFREIWGFLKSLELLSDVLPTFQQEAPERIPPLACDKPSAPTVCLLAKRRGEGWENHSSIFLFKWKHFLITVIKKRGYPMGEQSYTIHVGRTAYTPSPCQEQNTHLHWRNHTLGGEKSTQEGVCMLPAIFPRGLQTLLVIRKTVRKSH